MTIHKNMADELNALDAVRQQAEVGLEQQEREQARNPEDQPHTRGYYREQKQEAMGLLSFLENQVPYNDIGTKTQGFYEAFRKIATGIPTLKNQDWDVLVFDGQMNNTAISAVLFTLKNGEEVACFPLLVADSMEALPPRMLPRPGMQPIEVPQVASELLTSDKTHYLEKALYTFLGSVYGKKSLRLVEGLVLIPELEPTSEAQLRRVLMYAFAAVKSVVSKITDEKRFSLTKRLPTQSLLIHQDVNAGMAATSVGLPVRSDMNIKLSVADYSKNQSIGARSNSQFSTVRLFMSLQYIGDRALQMMQQPMYYGMPQPQIRLFQPYAILDSLDNQFSAATLETQLLALSSATSILYGNNWMQCFAPNLTITQDNVDSRDIGAITMDVNYNGQELGRINTKTSDFNIYDFCAMYMNPNVIFQIDVPELGDLTYIQRLFLEASGVVSKPGVASRATNEIIEAADFLTGNIFSQIWKSNSPLFVQQVGRVEQGYFIDENGQMRDLAEIDYVFLLNRVNVETAREYMNSFNPLYGDEGVRFAIRKRIYDSLFPNYKIRGFARRLTIDSNFLTALNEAVTRAGNGITIQSHIHNNQTIERGYENPILGLGSNQIQSCYQMGGYGQPYGQAYGQQAPQQVWRQYDYNTNNLDWGHIY